MCYSIKRKVDFILGMGDLYEQFFSNKTNIKTNIFCVEIDFCVEMDLNDFYILLLMIFWIWILDVTNR